MKTGDDKTRSSLQKDINRMKKDVLLCKRQFV